ncbi:Integral membrane protein [Streptococcus cristatus]|uniref:Integral membrane protein n=1 Tax=Streptococcus cristatus TaxID=45634 RepID=A0A139N381_STRCR|nr:Integral membrane protein [Streptococcus cristatus]
MKQFSNTIFNLGYFLTLTMTAIILLDLSGQILLSHTYIPLRIAEGVQFVSNPWYFYPILLLFLLSFFNPAPVGKGSDQVFFSDFVPHLTNAMTTGFYLVLKLPSENDLTFNLSKTRSFFPNHVY